MNQLYSVNEKFFEEIDSEEKAYILGFIFADGNISGSSDGHYRLRITLKATDLELLEKIKGCLEFTGEIKIRELKSKKYVRKEQPYMIAELSLSNKKLISDLKALGVTENKTFTCQFPVLKPELVRHFIRGHFDGDGSIYERNEPSNPYRKPSMRIELMSASEEFFYDMLKHIQENVEGITDGGISKRKTSIRITKDVRQGLRILNWLYKDATIYLDRKYKLYCYWRDKFLPPSSERVE